MSQQHLHSALSLIKEPLLTTDNTTVVGCNSQNLDLNILVKLDYQVFNAVSKDVGSYVNGYTNKTEYDEAILNHGHAIKLDTLKVYQDTITSAIEYDSVKEQAKEFSDNFSEFQEFAYNYDCPDCKGVGHHVCRDCKGYGTKTVQSYTMELTSKHVLRNNEWVYEYVPEKKYYDKEEKCHRCNGDGTINCTVCSGSGGLVELTRVSGKLTYKTTFQLDSKYARVKDILESKFENHTALVLAEFDATSFSNNVIYLSGKINFHKLTLSYNNNNFNFEYAKIENNAGKAGDLFYQADKILDNVYANQNFYDEKDVSVTLEFLIQDSAFKNIYHNLIEQQKTKKITIDSINAEVRNLDDFLSPQTKNIMVQSLAKVFKEVAVSHNQSAMVIINVVCLIVSAVLAYYLKTSGLLSFMRITQVTLMTSVFAAVASWLTSTNYVKNKHKQLALLDNNVAKPHNLSAKKAWKELFPVFFGITIVINLIISSNLIK